MSRRHRVLLPPRFAERLSAEDRARLQALQSGLAVHLSGDITDEEPPDPWQVVADLAQWYLVVATESGAATVTVDTERCAFLLEEAAGFGLRPSPKAVRELQRQWLRSSEWPCFPGTDAPPLLRGG